MDSLDLAVADSVPRTPACGDGAPEGKEREARRAAPLRVMFLCGSLEPGKDGVGDYTRLLLAQCRLLGLECCAVALNDGYVTQPEETFGSGGGAELRLPATMPWPERVEWTTNLRNQFRPDWVSIQFVPYAFHPKGVVWSLKRHLRKILGGVRVHLMLHELWIGASRTAAWKERVVGMLQRSCTLRLIRALRPASIATSNNTYVEMLRNYDVRATKLALFGNIPVAKCDGMSPWWLDGNAANTSIDFRKRDSYWLVIFFGTLHPEWEAEPLFSIIREAAGRVGRQVCFAAVGRLGVSGERTWARMARQYAGTFTFTSLGEQSPAEVSNLFQKADFGIAASPWQLIGKSGSAIAMLEHGLPVIANRDDWYARDVDVDGNVPDPLLHRCDERLEEKLVAGLPKREPRSGARETAGAFLESLRLEVA